MSDGRNVIYLYDGSFDGLLSAIFESYYSREIPFAIIENDNIQQELFYEYKIMETDSEKAQRVSNSIRSKISSTALINIYYTYLSDAKDKGRLCLDYIRAGYKFGKKTDFYLNLDPVNSTLNAVRRIRNEAEQYLGFVRFSELEGGVFYSSIEPKCNILPIIAPHFAKRLSNIPWIIHDAGRQLCMVYNGRECCLAPTDSMPTLTYSEEEKNYRRLWKKFYDTIEIKERHNERCRMSHMPKRMWKYLTEFEKQ